MARQRFIWPNIWDDPQLGKLSDTERVLYICCFSMADDEGRLIGDPAHLRSTAFAFKPRMSNRSIIVARSNIQEACSQFHVYDVGSVQYIQFLNWGEWQKPKYPSPSKLPPPPGYSLVDKRWIPGTFPQASGNVGGSLPEGSPTGRDGLGLEDQEPKAVTSTYTPREQDDETNGPGFQDDEEQEPEHDDEIDPRVQAMIDQTFSGWGKL